MAGQVHTIDSNSLFVGTNDAGQNIYIYSNKECRVAFWVETGTRLYYVVDIQSPNTTIYSGVSGASYRLFPNVQVYSYYPGTAEVPANYCSVYFNERAVASIVIDYYSTLEEAQNALGPVPSGYPITYRLTNATTTGPNEAAIGDTVTVPLTFPEGYGVVNPSSDAYVTCNGVLVPSTYSNGQLVFTMPDPNVS